MLLTITTIAALNLPCSCIHTAVADETAHIHQANTATLEPLEPLQPVELPKVQQRSLWPRKVFTEILGREKYTGKLKDREEGVLLIQRQLLQVDTKVVVRL